MSRYLFIHYRDSDADNFRKKMFAMSAKEQQIKSKINREKLE